MKITIRLIVSLIFVVALVAVIFSFQQVRAEKTRLIGDMERRAIVLAESLGESVKPLVESNSLDKLNRLVERFGNRERLEGVAIYDSQGNVLASTTKLALKISKTLPQIIRSITENRPIHSFLNIAGKEISLYSLPLLQEGGVM